MIDRPLPDEYPEYYNLYINLIQEGDIIGILEEQSSFAQGFFSAIPEEKGDYTYAFGKWTIKEVLGHMIDTERIMTYRLLRVVRKDKQSLPGFDQDEYVLSGQFFRRTMKDMIDEKLLLRAANLLMYKNIQEEDYMLRGTFNENEISARAIIYIIAGHELYHINFLKENYLTSS
jgi:hypothetical protein